MTIPQNDGFTVVLNRQTGQATYSADADTFSSEIDIFSDQVNTQATEINQTAIDVNADAALAQVAAEAASTSADYEGLWAGKTSAGTVGQSYSHLDYIWRLNVNVADISTSEPSESNSDWSYANGPLRSDLTVQKPLGSFDESKMSALSIDGTSGVKLRHSGESLGTYTGTSFSVGAQLSNPQSITSDTSGNFWVVGNISDEVFKYNPDGTYANFSFSVGAQETSPRGIATDSLGDFWVVGLDTDEVFKYNPDGTYANFSFSVGAQLSNPTGITSDSLGNFWVVGINADEVFKYNPDGTYANFSFSVGVQEMLPEDLAIDSLGNFWVVGPDTDEVFKYNPDGTYANFSFSVGAKLSSPTGITSDSFGNFWVVGLDTDEVFKYTPAPSSTLVSRFGDVDLGVMQIDSETNQAAMVKPLKGPSPLVDLDYSNKEYSDASIRYDNYAKFSEQQSSGSDGGDSVSGTQTRVLNTDLHNSISGVSRASNVVTVPAGFYRMRASAPAYAVNGHQVWIRDTVSGLALTDMVGRTARAVNSMTDAVVDGHVRLSEQTAIDVTHYTNTANLGDGLGFGVSSGEVMIYTELEIWKLD